MEKTVKILNPSSATPKCIYHFMKSVKAGGAIAIDDEILLKNIKNCYYLAYCYNEDLEVMGIAAIKNPQRSYVKKVMERHKSNFNPEDFYAELGYCYTYPEYKGMGICTSLLTELLEVMPVVNIFATTSNVTMGRILSNFGFKKTLNPYAIDDKTVYLYCIKY